MPKKKKILENKYWQAVGRRKTAVARVRLKKGNGEVVINKKKPEEYFENTEQALKILLAPLELVGKLGQFDISIKLKGGGKQAQIEAARLGIARALILVEPELMTTLRKSGFLTRDPRMKERKKPGLKGARRAPQWSKR
jgi:small subunit ribosomal protein S9